jgi:hypothetical protein
MAIRKKKCSECGTSKPISEFNKNKLKKDGHEYRCRECARAYRERNADELRKKARANYYKNRDKILKQKKKFADENKELLAKKWKAYQEKNSDKLILKYREYYRKNSKKVKQKSKEYYKKNVEERAEYKRNYQQNNKEKINKYSREYQRKRSKEDVKYKLALRLRGRLKSAVQGNFKKGSAVKMLGCSIDEFKEYIEQQFKPGMTWDNWAHDGWHLDHIIPLLASEIDLEKHEDQLIVCNWRNYVPMWAGENLSKGNKMTAKARRLLKKLRDEQEEEKDNV